MYADIVLASQRLDTTIRPAVLDTALVRRPEFDATGVEVWAKLENQQRTGSFKLRGATAKLMSLADQELPRGVVTASTGNHGAAVATAAASLGTTATVFVSDEADADKVDKIRQLGATISVAPGDPVNAERAARRSAADRGLTYVSPYNDPVVVAGQGTIGVELLRQLPGLSSVVVAVGGGGLISGIAATLKHHDPAIRVVAASAANTAAMHHSVAAGRLIDVTHDPTLSDGTAGGVESGSITFEMCRDLVDEWLLVDEESIANVMHTYMRANSDPIEGSAAVALAAVARAGLTGAVAVVICGGNVAASTLRRIGLDPEGDTP